MQPQKSRESYWSSLARAYASTGPPLRPSLEDVEFLEAAVARWAPDRHAPLEALLLGVTPQIAEMQWPGAARLLAVDKSLEMVEAVWPGDVAGKRAAIAGDWLSLPRSDSSCDIVVGDGSMNCLHYPDGFRALSQDVSRVLQDDGIFLLRCYLRPALLDTPEKMLETIFDSGLPSFHHFKFRLLQAMQPDARQGVAVNDVYRVWAARNIDPDLLVSKTGWERSAIDMMELYRGAATIHTFPLKSELLPLLLEFFEIVATSTANPCCPTLVLKPRRKRIAR